MAGVGKSVIGRIRKTNEDSILVRNEAVGVLPNLYIVADGMGGHSAGEVASGMAISGMQEYLTKNTGYENNLDALADAVTAANNSIYQKGSSDAVYKGMGTTLLAASVSEDTAHIVNIGDSRFYVLNAKEDRIEQITVDHSYVMELLRIGKISEEEAERHPKKNIITRALGLGQDVKCDRFSYNMNDGDILMLCSDGLTNMLTNEDMLNIFKEKENVNAILERLLESANEKGGIDNISVILYSKYDGV